MTEEEKPPITPADFIGREISTTPNSVNSAVDSLINPHNTDENYNKIINDAVKEFKIEVEEKFKVNTQGIEGKFQKDIEGKVKKFQNQLKEIEENFKKDLEVIKGGAKTQMDNIAQEQKQFVKKQNNKFWTAVVSVIASLIVSLFIGSLKLGVYMEKISTLENQVKQLNEAKIKFDGDGKKTEILEKELKHLKCRDSVYEKCVSKSDIVFCKELAVKLHDCLLKYLH
jgi:hypothetical protein